jgi:hypothetical protein
MRADSEQLVRDATRTCMLQMFLDAQFLDASRRALVVATSEVCRHQRRCPLSNNDRDNPRVASTTEIRSVIITRLCPERQELVHTQALLRPLSEA